MDDLDTIRAKHMTGGAPTQTSQMIRTLVALKSAVDVKEGQQKHVAIDPNGLVIKSLMRRLGQIVDTQETVTPESDLDAVVSETVLETVATEKKGKKKAA